MSDYNFNPGFSFLARCWWQVSGGFIQAEQWDTLDHALAPIWVQFGSEGFVHNDHWDRYLRAEPEGVKVLQLGPSDYRTSEHRYCELFWFGAYNLRQDRSGAKLRYEIRPYDRVWTPYNWILENNPSPWSGYVAMRRPSQRAGALGAESTSMLWSLGGLDLSNLSKGQRHCNIELLSPSGRLARRYYKRGAWLLNTVSGTPGLISLEIENVPHPAFKG
ncbi:hypothetical protein BGP84_17325 [Pseudomonas putida]|jgi:hypothetical protein|uniref:Uncharacterized protein n=1 Tax=Pseudomonas putida TaxID=303 RepID=A0A2S3X7G8_PSEPU|nr:hypothetical protein [Pseudomonas putida]POG11405.1 hypothetical protein BGP84_17325 [Pseudomonas putida]POG14678.1 hypothetical protein BGP85_00390 [Pseudomonas putida]